MPVKVQKMDDKWCVVEPDGSTVAGGCHPTENEAADHAAAINANTKDMRQLTLEKNIPGGVYTFDDADAYRSAMAKEDALMELTANYFMLTENVVFSNHGDRVGLMKTLSTQYVDRLQVILGKASDSPAELPEEDEEEEDEFKSGPMQKFFSMVSKALGLREKQSVGLGSDMLIYKDKGGTYRWLARYSNKYRDQDYPPEIISSESHRKFTEKATRGEVPLPELWLWHVKEWAFGQSEWVAYDEDGFAVAGGYIYDDPASLALAKSISKMGDVLVSHGMPRRSIVRDEADPTTIKEHETIEISPLPGWAAANKFTGFLVLGGVKEKEMAFSSADKKRLLEQAGVPAELLDAVEARNLADKTLADEANIESKEAEAQPEEEVVAELEPAQVTEEPVEEAGAETLPTPEAPVNEPVADTAKPELDELKEILKGTIELVKVLGEEVKEIKSSLVQEKQRDEARIAAKAEYSPLATLLSGARGSIIGQDEARLDGRTSLAKDKPYEAQPRKAQHTGIPIVDQFLN